MVSPATEVQFDGLVGPTHNYAGLSSGNLASDRSRGSTSHPRAAALQGIAKMRTVLGLGVAQAVLPPHDRPSMGALRAWGFRGSDEQLLASAFRENGGYLARLASSASAMWAANAATVAPSSDTRDGRVHLVAANLVAMPHRSLEAPLTERILRAIFADEARFAVHGALPGGALMGDEGAANHTRLCSSRGAVHLFAWGKRGGGADTDGPQRAVARQSFEASQAVARLLQLDPERALFPRQHPDGIDAGGFHTDVLAVGNGGVFLVHDLAFRAKNPLLADLGRLLGDELWVLSASRDELPVDAAINAYPFNSQLLSLPNGSMVIVAPSESEREPRCRQFLERVVAEENPVRKVIYLDLRQSMQNGGGPACLRLRVLLTPDERARLGGRVLATEALLAELEAWVIANYREQVAPADLGDPELARESLAALDQLTAILGLGSLYDFQRAGSGTARL